MPEIPGPVRPSTPAVPVRSPVWRVFLASTRNAWADFAATFTPLTWIFGWLSRILAQVVFYALIGTMLGSPDRVAYLFIGAAVLATAMESLLVVSTTTRERYSGTLPLLVASPTRLWPVFLGRSVQWLPSGVATATVALFVVGPVFGVRFTLASGLAAFGVLLLVAVTTYGYGLALAALVLRHMRLRNWATNLSYTVMMLVCGVTVPLSFWPSWVQVIGQVFPLTHALDAIRLLAAGDAVASLVLTDVGLALLVALGWYVIAAVSLERLASAGRREGTIEFAE
ncbi:ABC transporter permease [Pseudactinotalea sp.]|uniref:ABC transporter permease n=1 Tax=Pseudactinotalea sp. TaxID=1926260 RepID=UPI003B3AEAE7